MGDDSQLNIVVKAKNDASKVLNDVNNDVNGLGGKLKNAFDDAVGPSKMLLAGVTAAGVAVAGFGFASVKAFTESQDLIAQTNAVLKSTGGIAGITAQSVTDLATALQKTTKYSDEEIRSAQNLLLTFTSIGKDIFPQATETVLNMSTALGQDLKSSSVQLGKALQDPILGVSALRRVGVNFSEKQQDVIAKLVETGQKAKAQQLILKELNTEFGGSAAAAAGTFSGQIAMLNNQFNDLMEQVGEFIIKALQPALEWFGRWVKQIQEAGGLMAYIDGIWQRNRQTIIIVAGAVAGMLVPAFVALAGAIFSTVVALGPWALLGAAVAAVALLLHDNWGKVMAVFWTVKDALAAAWQAMNDVFGAAKDLIGAVGDSVFSWFKDRIDDITGAFQASIDWIKKHKEGLEELGAVIGLFLGPLFVKLAAQAVVTAVRMGASAAVAGASWAGSAIVASAAWTVNFAIMSAKAIAHGVVSGVQAVISGVAWVIQAGIAAAAWVVNFVIMAAQAVVTAGIFVAQAVIAGAAWVIALGPVALAIGAVAAAAFLVIRNWDTVKQWLGTAFQWIKEHWELLIIVLLGPLGAFIALVINNFDRIKGAFSSVVNWIRNGWNTIVGIFQNVGTAIGNAVSGSFKGIINTVISLAQNQVNTFIRAINGAINIINKIPKVNIPRIGELNLPRLARGTDNFAGGLAQVGEYGPEIVNLPRGASVTPARESSKILDALKNGAIGGMQVTINGNVINENGDAADRFWARVDRAGELAGLGAPV